MAGTSGFGVEGHQYEVRRFGGHTNFGVFIGFVDSKKNIQLNSRGLNILFVPIKVWLQCWTERTNRRWCTVSYFYFSKTFGNMISL